MIAINRPPRSVFEPGQLVRHRRYGYRGVVVDRDESCQADDQWYLNNQTQPDRDQPWFHVLVDGSVSCTYAASESLVADSSQRQIEHPLLNHFFSEFKNGAYVRNKQPWPG
jgi:heat shock protein HspQ